MGSGRGDRNQPGWSSYADSTSKLQWGPVVVTGISGTKIRNSAAKCVASMGSGRGDRNQSTTTASVSARYPVLQWGPVVVTGIRTMPVLEDIQLKQLQWGPVVVTGISSPTPKLTPSGQRGFNGVRSW